MYSLNSVLFSRAQVSFRIAVSHMQSPDEFEKKNVSVQPLYSLLRCTTVSAHALKSPGNESTYSCPVQLSLKPVFSLTNLNFSVKQILA